MFYFTKWDILVVDDEPDVLSLSRLTLRDFEVYGLPVELHVAETKAAAIELLNSVPNLAFTLSLAFVDVVMETDDAGLDLCNYIREEIGNRLTQIFIRTGQPGLAPEKAVIDQYEINGYFTKVEATEEKLYALVKSGIRQFLWSYIAQDFMAGLNEIISATDWRLKIKQYLGDLLETTPSDADDAPLYIAFDDTVLVQNKLDEQELAQLRAKFDQPVGLQFNLAGDKYVTDAENYWGIQIMPGPTNAGVLLVCHTAFAPPDDLVAMNYDFFRVLATLWQRAI